LDSCHCVKFAYKFSFSKFHSIFLTKKYILYQINVYINKKDTSYFNDIIPQFTGELCLGEYEESPCSVLPDICQQEDAEQKRASAFSSWGGKRGGFSNWGGKRGGFSNWGGKRAPFSTWGGKRVPFSTWGGKRAAALSGDKKGGNFNSWGGKRVAFSSWGGKRAPFSTWGGKRTAEEPGVFSAWGGKRAADDSAAASRDKRAAFAGGRPGSKRIKDEADKDAAIRRGTQDFYPWGGKRNSAAQ
jgi:hypothetical protein